MHPPPDSKNKPRERDSHDQQWAELDVRYLRSASLVSRSQLALRTRSGCCTHPRCHCMLRCFPFSTPDLLRHAVSISGLILVQPFVFFLFGIPDWTGLLGGTLVGFRLKQKTETSQQPEVAQFSIGEIIALTTVVALLLAATLRYAPPVNSLVYWPVLISSWVMLHTITALTIRVVMFHEFIVLAFLILAMTSTITGLGFAEHFTSQSSTDVGVYFQLYGLFIGAFAFSIAVLSAANASEIKPTAKTREG